MAVFIFSLLLLHQLCASCVSLDFEGALHDGMFIDLTDYSDTSNHVLAFRHERSAKNFKHDEDNDKRDRLSTRGRNLTLTISIDKSDCNADDKDSKSDFELSLSILLLNAANLEKNKVSVTINNDEKFEVLENRLRPETGRIELNQHLFRTWSTNPHQGLSCSKKSLRLDLKEWHDSDAIYFSTTLMQRVRAKDTHDSLWNNGCVKRNPPVPLFGCHGSESEERHQVCIRTELLCDKLPNCGQEFLPNSDESCSPPLTLRGSLMLLLYTFSLLCLSVVVFNVLRSCVLGRRWFLRHSGDLPPVLSTASRRASRAGAPPPSYEDVTKDDANEEPPTYSSVASSVTLSSLDSSGNVESRSTINVFTVNELSSRENTSPPPYRPQHASVHF